ncbi:hypothetical protein [Streptomyces sp. NPDC000134]|uniref:hypothetical protein n=1 Tax=Streptomyces sp. NPDC000134 TaxID=3364536 RepID=UPI0036863D32
MDLLMLLHGVAAGNQNERLYVAILRAITSSGLYVAVKMGMSPCGSAFNSRSVDFQCEREQRSTAPVSLFGAGVPSAVADEELDLAFPVGTSGKGLTESPTVVNGEAAASADGIAAILYGNADEGSGRGNLLCTGSIIAER